MSLVAPAPSLESRGRPVLLLISWSALLIMFAAVAPLLQGASTVSYDVVSLVMFAPAAACAVVLIRPEWTGDLWPRTAAVHVCIAAATAGLAVIAFIGCLMLVSGRTPVWALSDLPVPVGVFVGLQALGVLAEEVGWRGVVQRAGERLARPTVVSAVAGFLFGATHLGYWSLGAFPVLVFALTASLMSVTITSIFVGSLWQRMIPAVTVHLGVNLSILGLARQGEALATTGAALTAAVAMLAGALVIRGAFQLLARRRTHP